MVKLASQQTTFGFDFSVIKCQINKGNGLQYDKYKQGDKQVIDIMKGVWEYGFINYNIGNM